MGDLNTLWKLCFPLKGIHKIIVKVLHGLNDGPYTDNRLDSWSSLLSNKHIGKMCEKSLIFFSK